MAKQETKEPKSTQQGEKTVKVINKTFNNQESKEQEVKKVENNKTPETINISNSESEDLSADHELDNTYNSKGKMQSMRSYDSGYVSDEDIANNDSTIERVNNLKVILRKDLESIECFVVQEFIKLSQRHGGKIDVSNQDFINAKKSLIESDPDAPGNKSNAVY